MSKPEPVECPRCGAEFIPTPHTEFQVGERVMVEMDVGPVGATILKVNPRRVVIKVDGVERPRPVAFSSIWRG